MNPRFLAFAALALLVLSGCATTGAPRAARETDPAASARRQILLTVHQPESVAAGLTGTPSQRYLQRRYGATPSVERILSQLAREHRLDRVDGWPIQSLSVYCEVFALNDDRRVEDVIAALATDPRVDLVQPMNVFDTQSTHYDDPYADLQTGAIQMEVEQAHQLATGRGISIAFAYAGHPIALVDSRRRDAAATARLRGEAFAEIRQSLESLASLGAMDPGAIDAIAGRVQWVDGADGAAALAGAEMVYEGVPETLDAKRDALADIGRHCRADAVITSTTSSILVTQLAPLVAKPERFLNLHWLNPAYLIPVVELSTHPATSADAIERTQAAMTGIGKLPVVCGVAPGYIVPRLQALVMNEAARMVEEGVATAEEIDRATRFGLGLRFAAIGVVEFIDFGGADILHHASREMAGSIDAARYAAPPVIGRMMEEGRLGVKTGSGFYDYGDRDVVEYRRDVLARTLAQVRDAGLWRPPAEETLP